jgi:hypothetical protein
MNVSAIVLVTLFQLRTEQCQGLGGKAEVCCLTGLASISRYSILHLWWMIWQREKFFYSEYFSIPLCSYLSVISEAVW